MLKALLIFLFAIFFLDGSSQDKSKHTAQIYFSVGEIAPSYGLKSKSKPSDPFKIARNSSFEGNWNGGIDFFITDKFLITGNMAFYKPHQDSQSFESFHENNPNYSASYIEEYRIITYSIGIAAHYKYKRLEFTPRLSIGSIGFMNHLSEFYHKNEQSTIDEIYSYDYEYESTASVNSSLMMSFNIVNLEDFQGGIFFHPMFSYQKPRINYTLKYSNNENNYENTSWNTFSEKVTFFYFGVGLFVRQ